MWMIFIRFPVEWTNYKGFEIFFPDKGNEWTKNEDQVNDEKDAHKEDIGQSKSEDTSEGN